MSEDGRVQRQTVVMNNASMGQEDPLVKEACEWMVNTATEDAKTDKLSEGAMAKVCQMSKNAFNAIHPAKFEKAIQFLGHNSFTLALLSEKLEKEQEAHAKTLADHIGLQKKHTALQDKHIELQEKHDELQKKQMKLLDDYKGLDEKHNKMREEYMRLAPAYTDLNREHKELFEKWQELERGEEQRKKQRTE